MFAALSQHYHLSLWHPNQLPPDPISFHPSAHNTPFPSPLAPSRQVPLLSCWPTHQTPRHSHLARALYTWYASTMNSLHSRGHCTPASRMRVRLLKEPCREWVLQVMRFVSTWSSIPHGCQSRLHDCS